MKKHYGFCRLCQAEGELSYEHIPPKKAFNTEQVVFETMEDLMRGSYTKQRQGLGKYSLCERCNNLTGNWYADAYIGWAKQGFNWLDRLDDSASTLLSFQIMPLNVIKQIMVMMLAVSRERDSGYYDEIRRFVLNKERKYLPPQFEVFVYLKRDGTPRFMSDMVVMRVDVSRSNYIEAEIALPPFGYVVTTPVGHYHSLAEQQRLYRITWFSEFEYNVWTPVFLQLPIKETHEPFPLDYRSQAEVDEHYIAQSIQKRRP